MRDLLFRRQVLNNTRRLAGWNLVECSLYLHNRGYVLGQTLFFIQEGVHKSINCGLEPTHVSIAY